MLGPGSTKLANCKTFTILVGSCYTKNMKIAIAGFGAEGKANYAYWNTPENEVVIVDEREIPESELPLDASVITGEGAFSRLGGFDIVIRTAGLAPRKITTDGKIWSATNEFFEKCPAPIIGVTGTKGKGTTASLITSMLRAAGKTVHLVGNIGVPALEELPKITAKDIVVFELSSFQLWDLETSPHVAVVLMIEPDHLDMHVNMDEYIEAKANIARYQAEGDQTIYHPTNEYSRRIAYAGNGTKQRYYTPEDGGAYVQDGMFFVGDHALCSVDTLHIAGAHNLENACAAITAVKAFLPEVTDEQIAEGLGSFTGLPHRLKFIREVNGVRYFDDSIATTPGSAIAALRAFREPKVIILGGSDKGADYKEVIHACKETRSYVVAIGKTGRDIQGLCMQYGVLCDRVEGGMGEVVARAREIAENELEEDYTYKPPVVILSPASASFDQYNNYADRGERFITAVQAL